MKVLAIVAMVVGALEVLNAYAEFTAGGRSNAGTILLVGAVALAALALVGAGLQLFMRGRAAVRFARAAALFALVVFAGISAFQPFLSMASSLLGIVFPIMMLAILLRRTHPAESVSKG